MNSVDFSSRVKTRLFPEDARLEGDCGILIPAFNEEATLAQIVKVALAAELGPVLVVDDGSEDSSAKVAQTAGAAVLKLEQNLGKGGAVYLGAEALKTPVIVLIDADLIGLSPKHISDLANPVLSGEVNMTRGVFSGGRLATTLAQNLAPYLNGQRGIEREKLLSVPAIQESRYGIEVLITQAARTQKWRCQDIELKNVSQIMKEEKRGFWQGFKHRLQGYAEILKSLLKPKAHNKQSHN